MKKIGTVLLILIFICSSITQASAYYDYWDSYGDPSDLYDDSDDAYDKGYDEGYQIGYDDGYYEGVYESGGEIVYKTKKVPVVERVIDNHTRFDELWITALLTLIICIIPTIVFRYVIVRKPIPKNHTGAITVIYNLCAFILIAYIMYRIDQFIPFSGIVILWAIICKKILEHGKEKERHC